MKVIQEIKNDIMLLKNIGNIPKEVELVLLRKLTSLEKQLTLTDVGCSLPDLDARISEVESEIIKNKINDLEHKQAFKLGFSTCYYWIAEKLK